MTSLIRHKDKPCTWVEPRPHQDPSLRLKKYGPILPMEEKGFFARLFGR